MSEAMVFLCVYLLGFWSRGTQIANLGEQEQISSEYYQFGQVISESTSPGKNRLLAAERAAGSTHLRQRRRADVGGGGEVNEKLPEPSVWWGREPVRGGREEGESERVDRALSCLAIALSAFCFLLFL